MSDYLYSSELFLSELLRVASTVVWKNPQAALENEANVDSIEVEQYLLAVQGKLTFDLVYKFDEEALLNAGIPATEANMYANNQFLIPQSLKDRCLKYQTEYTIANYVEKNNYYRMLNGQPDLSDDEILYNNSHPEISDNITPIHLLDSAQLHELEACGYIQELIDKYPDKKYLNFLTSKKISIRVARDTSDFGLLWITDSEYGSLIEDFKEVYNSCRNMVTSVYYNKALIKQNAEYYGFISLLILFSTINHMQYKFLDADMARDFYDEESLKLVYDSYGVPYYQSIPIEFHKKIVKNMNILMSHKGSTKVFYDLCAIFGLSYVDIYEYYIMKSHKLDNDGKPIFEIDEETGEYDMKKMYDIYFTKIALYNDPMNEMLDVKNRIEYSTLTKNDPYWFDDIQLQNKIYNEDYNYMQSKYIGIQTTFDLMKILYENSYYMKMIIDNRERLSETNVYNNSTHTNSNIFELIIYTCALVCKKYGFEGNIPIYPHEIGKVMGFDFKQDLNILKSNISEDDYLKNDETLLKYLETMSVYSLDSIKKVYGNLTALRNYLVNKMSSTREVNEYWAYYNLYNTIMYSEYTESVFMKSDGTLASTFGDLLSDINEILYIRLFDDDLDFDTEISDMLYLIKSSCSELKNIQYSDNVNIDSIIEYLFKLLDFFKSAKSDLTGYEIIYSLVSKAENIMKLMSEITKMTDNYSSDPLKDKFEFLTDCIKIVSEFSKFKDVAKYRLCDGGLIKLSDKIFYTDTIYLINDYIMSISNLITHMTDELDINDYISYCDKYKLKNDTFNFSDSLHLLYDNVVDDDITE